MKITFRESTNASVGGGSSMEGTSAVGCAKKMVLPVRARSCRAGSPCLPSRTCFMQQRPRELSILVASEASRTCFRSLPIQLSFAHELIGSFGFLAPMSTRQSQHTQTTASGSPTPAHGGRVSAGSHPAAAADDGAGGAIVGTRRTWRSHLHSLCSGCWTLLACSSESGMSDQRWA